MRTCQIVNCGLPCSALFFHIISQTDNFQNKVLEHERVFWFSLQLFFFLKRLSLNKIFSGREPRQGEKVLQRFMDWLLPYLQGITDALVKVTKPMNPLTMGTESFHETLENFHTLTQLYTREDYTEFRCRESFKTKHLSFSEEVSETWSKKYIALHTKCPLFLSNFNETFIFVADFRKILMYQISC